jgi:CDP-6-deoxy-D-xylo-4-hexulose-3-dehydrase
MYSLASTTWNTDEISVATKLLASGELTMGKEVKGFEEEFANYIGTKYAVMFNSGSSANLAIFAALKYVKDAKLFEGDHVLVPAVSWSTTYYPVNQLGFILDFVDIDAKTLNIDIKQVESKITSKTKAIFVVNLLGNPANLVELSDLAKKHNLILLEDNCESLGASINGRKAGSFGLMSSHSFFFSHHICTMEGGMVNTDSKELMETLVSIRAHGWTRGLDLDNSVHPRSNNDWEDLFRFVLPGYNLRPIELSGAIGKVQLRKFPKFLEERRKNAKYFVSLFSESENFEIQNEHGESSWFGFSLVLKNKLAGKREKLIKLLTHHKIYTRPIVAGNFTLNPVMKHLDFQPLTNLDNSDNIHRNGFFIGNHHYDVTLELKKVFDFLIEFEKEHAI